MRTICIFLNFILLSSLFCILSCGQRIYKVGYPILHDGKYDTEFPYKNGSKELKEIVKTSMKIYCNTTYKSYIFTPNRKMNVENINDEILNNADEIKYHHKSVLGTGTAIFYEGKKIALVSCAHIFDKPDTMVTYYRNEGNEKHSYVQSISIKQKQSNFTRALPEDGDLEILLIDMERDIAILSKEFMTSPPIHIPVFNYPFGKAKDLEWGTFVYLIGYPKGHKIITKGIVSHPNRDGNGSFLLDALFNTGFSGGIVLAIRDGVPNFEIVGIVKSTAADNETTLVPVKDWDYSEDVPYDGPSYVNYKKNINYGITFAIPSEAILDLLKENREYLLKRGYNFDVLMRRTKK